MVVRTIRIYFAEHEEYFCFLNILDHVHLSTSGCPCGPYTLGHTGKRYVIEASAIDSHAGIIKMKKEPKDLYYYIYPKMIPGTIIAGKVSSL